MSLRNPKRIASILAVILLCLAAPAARGQAQEQETLLAGQILDQDVYDANQQLIGEVDDIIIKRSGRAKKLTLEYGGILDIGDRLVAVSFKNFSLKNGGVALEATQSRLDSRPEYNYFRHGLRPEYFYRSRPYGGRYRYPPPPPSSYYPSPIPPREEPYEWAFSPSRFLASAVMNRRLINEAGQHLGRVDDFLIRRKDSMVEKIIGKAYMQDDGGQQKEADLALPYMPLGFTAYGLVYDIEVNELKDMPVYPYVE